MRAVDARMGVARERRAAQISGRRQRAAGGGCDRAAVGAAHRRRLSQLLLVERVQARRSMVATLAVHHLAAVRAQRDRA